MRVEFEGWERVSARRGETKRDVENHFPLYFYSCQVDTCAPHPRQRLPTLGMEVIESFLRKQGLVKKWADAILGYELSTDDLWEQLKTGVDLCRLMLKIKDGYVASLYCGRERLCSSCRRL